MIVPDVNLLIYAVNADAPEHKRATAWWEQTLTGSETVGLPWMVVLAFIRLTTRRGFFHNSLSIEQAMNLVDEWLDQPSVVILEPTVNHLRTLRQLLVQAGTGGNLTSDAHLAAIAIEHGAELWSADEDFARFSGLKWRNPLD